MIRVLIMIAVAGFVLSVAMLSTAVAIGGPDALGRGAWSWASRDGMNWNWDDSNWGHGHHWRHGRASWNGPQTSRELAWSGADTLDVDVPADVQFTQADGPAKLVVSGPEGVVEDVVVDDGRIHFDHHMHSMGMLQITLTAPKVTRFDLHGRNTLRIADYRQDRLELDVSGSSEVTGAGQAKEIKIDISGAGDADLGKLPAEGADVQISGAGKATLSPSQWAKLDISGMGDVTLLTTPKKLDSNISGAGRIRQPEAVAAAPPPPAPAAAPAAPRKKGV